MRVRRSGESPRAQLSSLCVSIRCNAIADAPNSLFDNRGASWFEPDVPVQPARGLLLDVDMAKMEVHLALEIPSPAGKPSGSQGSMQQLNDGHWLIG